MPKSSLPRVSEHSEQANFVEAVYRIYNHRDDFIQTLLFAVPNGSWFGGSNPWAMFNKFKAEGFRQGVSDLLYLQPRGPYNYLAIEMKALDRKNKKDAVSPEQLEFLSAVSCNGGMSWTCYGCDEALEVFSAYMSYPVNGGKK